jgi:secreted trypsin-like serine protease
MAGTGEIGSLKGCLIAATLALTLVFAGAAGAKAAPGAHTSIIGGSTTTAQKWPWQIAFLQSTVKKPNKKPSERFICGGSLIAPTIVVTATHCATEVDLTKPEYFSVVGGRTNLNNTSQGKEVLVKDAQFPLTRSGVPRYTLMFDVRWDMAVLELAEPLPQQTIKLAGPDEVDLSRPGQAIYKTGWGFHKMKGKGKQREKLSLVLRQLKTAVQPSRACARFEEMSIFGMGFDRDSQLCLGDPSGRATSCYGDSGGPGVVKAGKEFRLVGATSYGTTYDCEGGELSVDAALDRSDTRDWIAGIAMNRAGVDVIGSGGKAAPLPKFCEIPALYRKKLKQAVKLLKANGCRAGKVKKELYGFGPRARKFNNTVVYTTEPEFALRNRGFRVGMVVAKWKPKPKSKKARAVPVQAP